MQILDEIRDRPNAPFHNAAQRLFLDSVSVDEENDVPSVRKHRSIIKVARRHSHSQCLDVVPAGGQSTSADRQERRLLTRGMEHDLPWARQLQSVA